MVFPNVVYYINLAHRTDRKEHFEKEMEKGNIPPSLVKRIEAVWTPSDGATGCALSHLFALQEFMKSPHQVALICEDDFMWSDGITSEHIQSFFTQLETVPFDMCLLAGNVSKQDATKYPFLYRIYSASTTSAYILYRCYAKTLYQQFQDCLHERLQHFQNKEILSSLAIDNHWKQLQAKHTWYIANPKLGLQRPDYSDIEKKCVSYNC